MMLPTDEVLSNRNLDEDHDFIVSRANSWKLIVLLQKIKRTLKLTDVLIGAMKDSLELEMHLFGH